ncbi:MAG TPA: lysophospholipid acyltransferase family protein [Xanthobacteraceae bacterium]|nr:lysophospholipid acyltransferase family protein [Xanthobacteraceae bacterium]
MWRKLRTRPWLQRAIGGAAAGYLRLVWRTSRVSMEPADLYDWIDGEMPVILTFWHGQHFLTPFLAKPHHRAAVMISRHADAELNALAAERLGIAAIRGSGGRGKSFQRKGAVAATRGMIEALANGTNVALTADVPKVARVASVGVAVIAQHSGRPIFPAAIASSQRVEVNSWDRAHVNLPFSKIALVIGEPVRVAQDASEAALEAARKLVEERLNAATARAEALVGRGGGTGHGR